MNEIIVAGIRKSFLIACAIVAAWMVLYAGYKEIVSTGLRDTQIYKVVGPPIYPLYYGVWSYILYRCIKIFPSSEKYIIILDGKVVIAGILKIPFEDIKSVDLIMKDIMPNQIMFTRLGKDDIRINSYVFTRPSQDIVNDLRSIIGLQ